MLHASSRSRLFVGLVASTAWFALPAPAGTARPWDPRVAAVLEGLQARKERLREISITYDWRLVHRVTPEGNSYLTTRTGSLQPAGKIQDRENYRVRVTWACKRRKLLLDERDERIGGKPRGRTQRTYDGEKILTRYYPGWPDKKQPKEEVSDPKSLLSIIGHGADRVGLSYCQRPLDELLKARARVHCLGYERGRNDRCLVLDIDDPVQDPDQSYGRARLWIDLQHGFLLRRLRQYDTQDRRTLASEMVAAEPREWAPGLFLAMRVTYRSHNVIERASVRSHKYGRVPSIVGTAIIRRVVVGSLPDQLFHCTPSPGRPAFDARTGAWFGSLPRRTSDREVAAAADRAQGLLKAKALPVQLHLGPPPESLPARDQDCGPQCLYVICRTLGVRASIEELRHLAHTSDEGTSLEGLAEAARAKGLKAQGVQVTLEALRRERQPVIGVSPNHFYLLMGFNGPAVVLLSPPGQIFVLPAGKLSESWDGRVLLVRR